MISYTSTILSAAGIGLTWVIVNLYSENNKINQFKELISSTSINNKLKEKSTILISCLYDIKTISFATHLNKQLGYLNLMYPSKKSLIRTVSIDHRLNIKEENLYGKPTNYGGQTTYSKHTLIGPKKFDSNFLTTHFKKDKFEHILLYNFASVELNTPEILGQINSITNPNSILFIINHESQTMSEFQKMQLERHDFKQSISYSVTNNLFRIDSYIKRN